jgi:hypothetical protein
MEVNKTSPRVTSFSWGRVEVEGKTGFYTDAKLFPGGSREWDWRETGTSHESGIQPEDVEELLANGARVIVLAQGFYGRLSVALGTLELLEQRGVVVHMQKSEEAVKLYNELAGKEKVGALIHSTC